LPINAKNFIVDAFLEKIDAEKILLEEKIEAGKNSSEEKLASQKLASQIKLLEDKLSFQKVESKLQMRILELEKDLQASIKEALRASGLLTSRGIFEWSLKKVFLESKSKGKFNASEMIKGMLSSTITPTKSSSELMEIFIECEVNTVDDGLKLWEQLSADIHGYAWNGPAVKIYSSSLSTKNRCVIKKIAASLTFDTIDD
jgi:hypothetical protein